MIDWLLKNKEWVFSGVGVTVLVSLVALFRSFGKKQRPETAPVVVRIEHTLANGGQPDMSASAVVAVERIAPITPGEIQTSIETAPPLQLEAVAKRYIGQRIEWDTELANAQQMDGLVKLQLRAQQTEKLQLPVFVWCNVNLADYRELAVLPEGALIRVSGTIETATLTSVRLTDARLTFLSAKSGV